MTSSEINMHFTSVFNILKVMCDKLGVDINTINKSFAEYEHIHLDNNQKKNSMIRYPPILISKTMNKIQTNAGFIIIGNFEEQSKDKIEYLETTLNLKEYNRMYYYVDTDSSHKSLEKYYNIKELEEEWANCFTSKI